MSSELSSARLLGKFFACGRFFAPVVRRVGSLAYTK